MSGGSKDLDVHRHYGVTLRTGKDSDATRKKFPMPLCPVDRRFVRTVGTVTST